MASFSSKGNFLLLFQPVKGSYEQSNIRIYISYCIDHLASFKISCLDLYQLHSLQSDHQEVISSMLVTYAVVLSSLRTLSRTILSASPHESWEKVLLPEHVICEIFTKYVQIIPRILRGSYSEVLISSTFHCI